MCQLTLKDREVVQLQESLHQIIIQQNDEEKAYQTKLNEIEVRFIFHKHPLTK